MLSRFHTTRWTMHRKLLLYMLLLSLLLLFSFFAGFLILGRVESADRELNKTLDFQMQFFEKDMQQSFNSLAAASIDLSSYISKYIDEDRHLAGTAFRYLSNDDALIRRVQDDLILPLSQRLEKQNCSGIFMILDATLNSRVDDAAYSRTGLYLYQNRFNNEDRPTLLRGDYAVGKSHDIMPHRKWRMEFRIDQFPNYEAIVRNADQPLTSAYMLTDAITIDGTTDQVLFMAIPIVGRHGEFYGICGFEVSTDYFMTYHAQPSNLSRPSFLIAPYRLTQIDAENGLCCGAYQDYYHPPSGPVTIHSTKGGLTRLESSSHRYVGKLENIQLTPNNSPYILVAMIEESDYQRLSLRYSMQIAALLILVLFFSVNCCIYFSQRYLRPILKDLEKLKTAERNTFHSSVPEFMDLFQYLSEQDQAHLHSIQTMKEHLEEAQSTYRQAQENYRAAQNQLRTAEQTLSHLKQKAKDEIEPDNYEYFLSGIQTLTKTEREIFDWYLEGKSTKEIMVLANIKESTLKYHNHNILGKLGVSSRKQMLRYVALMNDQK